MSSGAAGRRSELEEPLWLLAPPGAGTNPPAGLVKRNHHPAVCQEFADLLFRVEALRSGHHGLSCDLGNLCFHGP
jgi:hypothetical protein